MSELRTCLEMPTARTFLAFRSPGTLSSSIPLVGRSGMCGNGPAMADTKSADPQQFAGKIFTTLAPARLYAVWISVGVIAPGIMSMSCLLQWPIRPGSVTGLMTNDAPAFLAAAASRAFVTVPAPTSTLPSLRSWSMIFSAFGVVSVTSTALSPPRTAARTADTTVSTSASFTRTHSNSFAARRLRMQFFVCRPASHTIDTCR
mmetsp:Transcript_3915/g.11711  ORF Transcript_3915/g.11711 Transcript_3915/m.11711 type:complete len:203 (-) Transcript_3915:104-712(-)